MEKCDFRLEKLKCAFFQRLIKNDYTRKVIKSIENFYSNNTQIQPSKKSVITEIKEITSDTNQADDIYTRCTEKIAKITRAIATMHENDIVKKLKESLTKINYSEEIAALTYVTFASN